MFKYIAKRILYALLSLWILLTLVFFLMQVIPGYPIEKPQNISDAEYLQMLEDAGLLKNPVVQYFEFLGSIFTGTFGKVFNSSQSVIQYTLQPMQYTIMIAAPAFILSSVIGIGLGILSAYYRGKFIDHFLNVLAALFLAVPSFVLALYLVKLAGIIGLPTQFIAPGNGSPGDVFKSMLMPIMAMTMTSISVILYYTRNELVDIFKQDYIKTALAKGISFKKIVFTHALRNAAIPIIACLLPSFIGILSGSIIIEHFFGIPGTSNILVHSIESKEIYVVLFCVLFYSGIYFLGQIIVDVSYSFIDPRIKLAENSSFSLSKRIKAKISMLKNKQIILNNNYKYYDFNNTENNQVNEVFDINTIQPINYVTNQEILLAEQSVPIKTLVTPKYELSNFIKSKIKTESFKFIPNYSYNNEQIVGKPSTYMKDLFKRFCKSKVAIIFSIIFISIFILAISFTLANPNSTNISLGGLTSNIVGFLPPRIPFLGLDGTIDRIVSGDVYNSLLELSQTEGVQLWTEAIPQGSSYLLVNYNPYVLPSLKNVYPIMGTDGLGRDWWNMMWYSTTKSLILAIITSAGAVAIGTIYGSIAGSFAGKAVDTILMRIVEILSGVPLIVWVLILSVVVSGGNLSIFTICFTLIITSWMGPATIARTYIIKYKDAEFVQAAQTLGASKARIIFSHLLPNTIGRLIVQFVNKIPVIIFFETSLVFLGLKSSNEVSLGTMINTAYLDGYLWLLIGPTLTLILTTLSSNIIANNLNDSIDPAIVG